MLPSVPLQSTALSFHYRQSYIITALTVETAVWFQPRSDWNFGATRKARGTRTTLTGNNKHKMSNDHLHAALNRLYF